MREGKWKHPTIGSFVDIKIIDGVYHYSLNGSSMLRTLTSYDELALKREWVYVGPEVLCPSREDIPPVILKIRAMELRKEKNYV